MRLMGGRRKRKGQGLWGWLVRENLHFDSTPLSCFFHITSDEFHSCVPSLGAQCCTEVANPCVGIYGGICCCSLHVQDAASFSGCSELSV